MRLWCACACQTDWVMTEVHQRRSGTDVRQILESLPDWFGDPEAIDNYVAAAEDVAYGSYLAIQEGVAVGVALVRRHFPEAAELHLIAVHPTSRGKGVGHLLVQEVASKLADEGCAWLSVHTVGPSFSEPMHDRSAMGHYQVP